MFETSKLHKYCRTGNLTSVKIQIKKGGSPNRTVESRGCSEVCTSFEIACWYGHFEIVKYLYEHGGADPTVRKSACISYAARSNNLKLFKYLEATGKVDIHRRDDVTIVYAAKSGSTDIFKYLYKTHKLDVTNREQHCIRTSAFHGHRDILKILLRDPNVDPSVNYNYPIRAAIRNKHYWCAEALTLSKNFRVEFNKDDFKDINDKNQKLLWTYIFRNVKNISLEALNYITNRKFASILFNAKSFKERQEMLAGTKPVKLVSKEELSAITKLVLK